MVDKERLVELAERCEAATGPDRELNIAMLPLVGLRFVDEGHPIGQVCYDHNGHGVPMPNFTASLDAAMTLVPEGWAARVENWPRPHGQADMAHDGGPKAKAVLMECLMIRIGKRDVWGFHTPGSASVETRAATPALALCAAALKALASNGAGDA